MIASPVPGMAIIGLYLYFVTSWGPRYMKDRKPFVLKGTLIAYNFIQVMISVYLFTEVSLQSIATFPQIFIQIFIQGLNGAWLRHYSWRCQPVNWNDDDLGRRVRKFYIL